MWVLIALVSYKANPVTKTREIWISDKNLISVQWDTGYGFNPNQELKSESPLTIATDFEGIKIFRVKTFTRLIRLSGLKVNSTQNNLRIFTGSEGVFHELHPKAGKVAEGWVYNVDGPELTTGTREGKAWVFFFIGVSILAATITGWVSFFTNVPRSLMAFSLALLFALALTLTYTFPGFANPFNPMEVLKGAESLLYVSNDSILLSLIWSSLYEVFPSFYFLLTVQSFLFVSAFCWIAAKLNRQGWPLVGSSLSQYSCFSLHLRYLRRILQKDVSPVPTLFVFWLCTPSH